LGVRGELQQPADGSVGLAQLDPVLKDFLYDTAVGDGVTKDFTMSASTIVTNIVVTEDGVTQERTTDFTVSGTTLSFVVAPAKNYSVAFGS